jgi:transcriptional regulator with XRE-family HTH domain
MFTTGRQIKAARALLGWRRDELAKAAKLHINSIAYWEAKEEIPDEPVGVQMISAALGRYGVVPTRSGVGVTQLET